MRRKKSGVTFIVAIIIFMFISTVSIAMISMISGNYRARVSESNRVQNLYSSESGLDVAYNIMVKTFDAATIYGYYEVEILKTKDGNTTSKNNQKKIDIQDDIDQLKRNIDVSKAEITRLRHLEGDNKKAIAAEYKKIQEYNDLINEDNQMTEILLNEEFKRAFKYFIKAPQVLENYEVSPNELENSMSNKSYVNKVINSSIKDFQTAQVDIPNTTKQTDESGNEEIFPKLSAEVVLNNTSKTIQPKLTGHIYNVAVDIEENDEYAIKLKSIFQSTKEKTNTNVVGNNIRTVQATYKMVVPEYRDVFFGQGTDNINEYVVLKNKALMVGKEMKVGNIDKSLDVTGDVFVEGKSDSSVNIDNSNRTYEKYHGGIIINSESGSNKLNTDTANVIFDDNVITRGTFNLQNNMKVNIEGDLYANNLYAGKISENDFSEGSVLNANNVILDNDLTVKADSTRVGMNCFYGINDKNTNFNSCTKNYNNISNETKERTSSSIIVNSQNSSSAINISKEAYIMGVAHIDTKDGYQTGESTAVKGNYVAYAVPLDSTEKLKYDYPLQVLEEDNVFKKANHFSDYWNKTSEGNIGKNLDKPGIEADNGGISLPDKIYSTGAIVYKDGDATTVKPSQYNLDVETDVNTMRIDYASKVYRMGAESDIDDYNLLGENADSVEDLIYFPGISETTAYDMDKELKACVNNNGKEMAIFNEDSPIVIDGNKIKVGTEEYNVGSTIKAVIVTKGDVTIKDNVDFCGNIITCGNLNIEGEKISIKYDQEIIDRIKLKNSELFKNVFKNIATKDVPQSSSAKEVKLEDVKSQYDISKFLENKLWNIIK